MINEGHYYPEIILEDDLVIKEVPEDAGKDLKEFTQQLTLERLTELVNDHGICTDCGYMYDGCNEHDGPFASCNCKTSEWYTPTPYMRAMNYADAFRACLVNFVAVYSPQDETQKAVWEDAMDALTLPYPSGKP